MNEEQEKDGEQRIQELTKLFKQKKEVRYPSAYQRHKHELLTDWYGLAPSVLGSRKAVTAEQMLKKIIVELKLEDRVAMEEMQKDWRENVGDFVANHSQPESLNKGELTVRVLQATVHHHLKMQEKMILKRLQDRYGKGKIRRLYFRLG
jgi:predicted nucleic acid-binding Zn ribbon protein